MRQKMRPRRPLWQSNSENGGSTARVACIRQRDYGRGRLEGARCSGPGNEAPKTVLLPGNAALRPRKAPSRVGPGAEAGENAAWA